MVVDRLRALQTKQKAALVRWERGVRELEATVAKLAHLEQKVERFTLNVFREGGYPITPRQRSAIEARPQLAASGAGGMDYGAWRRRIVYDARIGEVRELEARWQPRIDAARARVHAATVERHEAAQQVLAVWPDPEPVTGHSRRSLSRL
jgi:hypothetical protein